MTQIRTTSGLVKTITLIERAVIALLLSCVLLGGFAHSAPSELEDEVAQSMRAIWDRPEAPLTVEPVVIEGDYALAGWTQQARGGRALLVRHDGRWQVHICGGDGLKDIDALKMAGLKESTASRLIAAMNNAEADLPTETKRKFASFGQNILVNDEHAPH